MNSESIGNWLFFLFLLFFAYFVVVNFKISHLVHQLLNIMARHDMFIDKVEKFMEEAKDDTKKNTD